MDEVHFLSQDDERAHYCTHENVIGDHNYRKFLSKLYTPLRHILSTHKIGLDYGCGPGPALCAMLEEDGYEMHKFDPFFYPNKTLFSKRFDFITCSETVEHFYDPFKEFNTFNDLLKPGGWLGIMTSFLTTDDKFENWYYRRDPTHVTFYCEKTFQVMASQRDWTCEIRSKDVVLMQKNYD